MVIIHRSIPRGRAFQYGASPKSFVIPIWGVTHNYTQLHHTHPMGTTRCIDTYVCHCIVEIPLLCEVGNKMTSPA